MEQHSSSIVLNDSLDDDYDQSHGNRSDRDALKLYCFDCAACEEEKAMA